MYVFIADPLAIASGFDIRHTWENIPDRVGAYWHRESLDAKIKAYFIILVMGYALLHFQFQEACRVNRFVSFGLLLAVILVFGFVFFKVMAGFFLPLFLAALLVVLFRPLHQWILKKVKGRPKIAAFLTTSSILLIVLLPFSITLFFAASETRSVIRKLDPSTIDDKIKQVRTNLSLDIPALKEFEGIERTIAKIQEQEIAHNVEQRRERVQYDITDLRGLSIDLGTALSTEGFPLEWKEIDSDAEESAQSNNQVAWNLFARELFRARLLLADDVWDSLEDVDAKQKQLTQASDQFKVSLDGFYEFKTGLLGGPLRAWCKEKANPDQTELKLYIEKATEWLRAKLLSFGGATTAFIGRFLFGVIILAIALFSFLLDGPAMLNALKQMSPLDDEHEDELIAEFDKVSRAVVLATLLSALAQGLLASIGFYFAGLNSIILLMLLTSVLALVPFVGAAAVWVPASLWLIFIDGRMSAGIFLAIYGAAVVSMADNIIKPFILHGQSNLHPLWALLSVLGGVSALGPVGILIGPMIVVFLQTLLKILQREISSMDDDVPATENSSTPAES